jgi:hypothetical protein
MATAPWGRIDCDLPICADAYDLAFTYTPGAVLENENIIVVTKRSNRERLPRAYFDEGVEAFHPSIYLTEVRDENV